MKVKKNLKLICAVDTHWGLGVNGKLLFHIKKDMEHFKELTMNHKIVMGRKTQQSLPEGKPLCGRENIVLTRRGEYAPNGFSVCHSIEEIPSDCFVIGGGEIYRQLLPYADTIYVTKVEAEKEADVYFPNLDIMPEWKVVQKSPVYEENGISFSFITYKAADEKTYNNKELTIVSALCVSKKEEFMLP